MDETLHIFSANGGAELGVDPERISKYESGAIFFPCI